MTKELLVNVIIAIATIGATLIALGAWVWGMITFLIPLFEEYRNKKILKDKLGRGSYDEATIERSTKNYIRPKCSNIDPAQEAEPRHALMATREDLFQKVDYFLLSDDSKRHLLILADSGMGKTSFLLNYYAYSTKWPHRKKQFIALIHLGSSDADERLKQIKNPEETVVFLDAFDEDTKAVNNHKERINQLMQLCNRFHKVIITCRTQFFPKDEEIPLETGLLKIHPTRAGEKKAYEFWKLYLSPFDDVDVKQYINKRYPFWMYKERKKAFQMVSKIPLLGIRPMLLAHIPDLIEQKNLIEKSSQLYDAMINAWLERESYWVDQKELREFSEKLAVEIYTKRELRGGETVTYDELLKISENWSLKIDRWKVSSRSLLNRDANGNYKFAHRSIMEYLFVHKMLKKEKACYGLELTDLMKQFLNEILNINFPNVILMRPLYFYDMDTLDAEKEAIFKKSLTDILDTNEQSIALAKGILWVAETQMLFDTLSLLCNLPELSRPILANHPPNTPASHWPYEFGDFFVKKSQKQPQEGVPNEFLIRTTKKYPVYEGFSGDIGSITRIMKQQGDNLIISISETQKKEKSISIFTREVSFENILMDRKSLIIRVALSIFMEKLRSRIEAMNIEVDAAARLTSDFISTIERLLDTYDSNYLFSLLFILDNLDGWMWLQLRTNTFLEVVPYFNRRGYLIGFFLGSSL